MSQDFPSPRMVTASFASAGIGILMSSIVPGSFGQTAPSFFVQACPSNTGYIFLAVSSALQTAVVGSAITATNCIVALDSGQSIELKASDWDNDKSRLRFQDFIIAGSSTDQAVITVWV